jgi:hypothetical protein
MAEHGRQWSEASTMAICAAWADVPDVEKLMAPTLGLAPAPPHAQPEGASAPEPRVRWIFDSIITQRELHATVKDLVEEYT